MTGNQLNFALNSANRFNRKQRNEFRARRQSGSSKGALFQTQAANINSHLAVESERASDFRLLVPGHLNTFYDPRLQQCDCGSDFLYVAFDFVKSGGFRPLHTDLESALAADRCDLVPALDYDRDLVLEDTVPQ